MTTEHFLSDVFSLLVERNLHDTFAVSCLPTSTTLWVERPHVNSLDTITEPVDEAKFASTEGIHAEWTITTGGVGIEMIAHKKRVDSEGGGYKKDRS